MALPRTQYDDLFRQAEEQYGLPYNLLKAIAKTESNFNPNAVSSAGAKGLMQFTDGTAKDYKVNQFDPASSIDGAGRYMRRLIDMFGGDVGLALSAYNGGPGTVKKWLETGKARTKENQEYAPKVFKNMGLQYDDPLSPVVGKGNYSFYSQGKNTVPVIPDAPYQEGYRPPRQLSVPQSSLNPSLMPDLAFSLDPTLAETLGLTQPEPEPEPEQRHTLASDYSLPLTGFDTAVEPTPSGFSLANILAAGMPTHVFPSFMNIPQPTR